MMNTGDAYRHPRHESSNLEEWPAAGLELVPYCPICGYHKRILLYTKLTDRAYGGAPGEWTLYHCAQCKSAWLDPRPTRDTINRAYTKYFTHLSKRSTAHFQESWLRFILRKILNDYRNSHYGLKRKPTNVIGRWIVPLVPPLCAAIDAGYRHLPCVPTGGGWLLDVGCGNGDFLNLATEMGWSAEGFDFDIEAVETARALGRTANYGCIDDLKHKTGEYDVITVSHVIEHIHNPLDLVGELHRLLKPGGMLWLETPNINSIGSGWFGRDWRGLEPPRHLQLFNVTSLKNLIKAVGFKKIQQRWHGLATFDIFAASEAIAANEILGQSKLNKKISLATICIELYEMLVKNSREFITLIAWKCR